MSVKIFIQNATERGIKLTVNSGEIAYTAPKGIVTPAVLDYLRNHKSEIIAELTPTPPPLAVLLQLPDGRQFWLAPDGFEFNHGETPILRHSVMDALNAAGGDVSTEIKRLIDMAHEMGGELTMKPSTTDGQATHAQIQDAQIMDAKSHITTGDRTNEKRYR